MRRRVLAGALLLAGLLAWGVWRSVPRAGLGSDSAAVQPGQTVDATGAVVGTGDEPEAASVERLPVATPAPAHCGLPGALPALLDEPLGRRAADRMVRESGEAWTRAALVQLQAADDADTRATGVLMAAWPLLASAAELTGCESEACQRHAQRLAGQGQQRWAAEGQALRELVLSARDSSSPLRQALAWQACQHGEALPALQGACSGLSAERWAQLDPDNAAAWLQVADEARERGDASGVTRALYRAAQAGRLETLAQRLRRQAVSHLPEGSGWPRLGALVAFRERSERLGGSAASAVAPHCAEAQLADDSRRQLCAELAMRLISSGPDIVDLGLGLTLAERAGVPAERLAAARREMAALESVGARMATALPQAQADPADCGPVLALSRVMERGLRGSERSAWRRESGDDARAP